MHTKLSIFTKWLKDEMQAFKDIEVAHQYMLGMIFRNERR